MTKNEIKSKTETMLGHGLETFSHEDHTRLSQDACQEDPYFYDDYNPAFILNGTPNSLLALIAEGKINLQDLAKVELAKRGYDTDCNWVGFNR